MSRLSRFFLSLLVAATALFQLPARAEMKEVTIADQFGLAYLPLMVMQERKLLEKHAKELGLGDVKVNWAKFGGASTMNDAILSGSVQFATIGTPGLVLIWDKTRGTRNEVKGLCAINSSPMYLNTRNPEVKSLKDLTGKDKIALPAVKSSYQAIALQMAAAKEFGDAQFDKLDALTVSMKHPDAMASLLSKGGEVTTHFASPPFMYQELKSNGVRKILSTREVSGDSTFVAAYATKRFVDENPKLSQAFLRAVEDAIAQIKADRKAAAATYVALNGSAEGDLAMLTEMLSHPDMEYGVAPKGTTKIAAFMKRVGTIRNAPASWKEMFFPLIHGSDGS